MNSKLCSSHFDESCHDKSPWLSQKRFKPDAVLSVFDFPEHMKKRKVSRQSPRKHKAADTSMQKTLFD